MISLILSLGQQIHVFDLMQNNIRFP